jgi:hypothetical protein
MILKVGDRARLVLTPGNKALYWHVPSGLIGAECTVTRIGYRYDSPTEVDHYNLYIPGYPDYNYHPDNVHPLNITNKYAAEHGLKRR